MGKQLSDRELLIRLDERTISIEKKLDTHLAAHRWFNRCGLAAVISAVVGTFFALVKRFPG
jgi:hypothetical protein